MLTLIITVTIGVIAGTCFSAPWGLGLGWMWGAVSALGLMILIQLAISLLMRYFIKKINQDIQTVMLELQKKLEQKQQQFMRRPPGSPKVMMQILEKDQKEGLAKALAACDKFKPLYKWGFLLENQVNAMKMAFNYQMKNFDEVDKLLPKCTLMDPQAICMKLARMYKNNDPDIAKFFKKKCSKLKGEECVLPYSMYAWMLVKQDKASDALNLLIEAKKKTENETIRQNWEFLANGKNKQFSNSSLGEIWYAMGLEEPKMPKVQQRYQRY